MKKIQQLLQLSNNPHYHFTDEERTALDAFLEQQRATPSKKSQKKRSKKQSDKTPVTVRNIVKKADTYPPEAF